MRGRDHFRILVDVVDQRNDHAHLSLRAGEQAQQIRVTRQFADQRVKAQVEFDAAVLGRVGGFGDHQVKQLRQARHAGRVRLLAGRRHGGHLQAQANLEQVVDFAHGHLAHEEPATRLGHKDALAFQAARSLAHRRPADRHLPRDLGFDHAAARRQPALHDRLGEPVLHHADQVGDIDGFERTGSGRVLGHGILYQGDERRTARERYNTPFFSSISVLLLTVDS
ncbi:hypothetical protein D3C72_1576440 [compost metagenome]